MKRFLILASLVAGLSLRPATVHAAPMLLVGSVSAAPGSIANVPITLNAEAKNVSGVALTLTPAGGPATGSSRLAAAPDPQSPFTQIKDALFDWAIRDGVFRAAMVQPQPFDGPLPVVTVRIQVPADAPAGVYPLQLAAKLNDPDGRPIAVTVQDGQLTVQR